MWQTSFSCLAKKIGLFCVSCTSTFLYDNMEHEGAKTGNNFMFRISLIIIVDMT